MHHQLIILIVIWSVATLPFPKRAGAETALTRAVVQSLRNLVQLIPQNKTARQARVSDGMTPGDALSTGRSSLAELRFNDGSLARIGEQAVFRFVQQSRNFNLSNGTVLMLIPPGRGRTDVRTPNASAAIRGSALFIRYIPETATTAIGALTNSNIEVYNQQASQSQVLQAGQLAVIVKNRIVGLYKFDLKTFYETSNLVQGLNLNKKSGLVSSDPAIALVQAETSAALAAQSPLTGAQVIMNPAFVRRPNNGQGLNQPITLQEDTQNPFNSNFSPVTEFLENGEIIVNPERYLPSNTQPLTGSPDGGFSSGSEQQNEGNNGISDGVGGGINNPSNGDDNGNNGVGDSVGGGINNPSTDNANSGANNPGNATNNSNNGIGDGVGGGGVNNPGGNGNGNGGANNTGNATDNGIGNGVGGGGVNNPSNGNGNNGIGDGVGGGGVNNPGGNGNGNGGANNTGNATDNGGSGIGVNVGGSVNNPGGSGIGVSVGGSVNPGNGNGNNGIGNGVGGGGVNNTGGNGNGNGGANNTGNNNRRDDDD